MPDGRMQLLASSKVAGWASPAHITFAGDHRDWERRRMSAHPESALLRRRVSTERSARTTGRLPEPQRISAYLGAVHQLKPGSSQTSCAGAGSDNPDRRSGARPIEPGVRCSSIPDGSSIPGGNLVKNRHQEVYSGAVRRTQIYLGDDELELLDRVARTTGASRSELVRRAVRNTFGEKTKAERLQALESSAGAFRGQRLTGADYVDVLRSDLNQRLNRQDLG